MISTRQPSSFARKAAKTALAPSNPNITNIQRDPTFDKMDRENSTEIDKIVESVTNATKRLSQVSTNTNSSKRKSKNHVGPWRLGRTLGRGSTGRVRLAKHSETGQLAAVKIVPKSKFKKNKDDYSKDSSPYGIEREIIIMKLISHQNIMGLYDVWENKGELYLVLEYVEGGELFDYLIKKGKLQEKEAVHYFRQIISGVGYCHQFNICHRDLKPENLLLDKNLNIKIADFGMAALEVNQKLLETSCGSPHYASPEIVTGKTYHGSPSDVWSCGIILFALLTGHLPFDDENIRKLLMKVQNGRFVMPNYLSSEAKDLIWKMLKVNPKDRIAIYDVLKHPLLRKYETTSTLSSKQHDRVKLETYYNEVDSLKITANDIDRDLLKSLAILFHGVKESSLIPKLLKPQSSPEKMFYYLLFKYKKQHQLQDKEEQEAQEAKASEKRVENGDGLLKKSKSTVQTTTTNEDGTQTVETKTINLPGQLPSLPSTPKSKKKVSKTPSGLQITASSSYRRGVSFNNKSADAISRSSSRKSLTSVMNQSTNEKKRRSILPPLPDLGADWLNYGSEELGSSEFSALYREIFNYQAPKKPSPKKTQVKKPVTPKRTNLAYRSPKKSRKESHKLLQREAFQETPLPSTEEEGNDSPVQRHPTTIRHTPSKPLSKHLTSFEVPAIDRRLASEPAPASPSKKKALELKKQQSLNDKSQLKLDTIGTLDPKGSKRLLSHSKANILNELGFNLTRSKKTSSKIYYSKSSTSINLASILKNDETSQNLQGQKNHLESELPTAPEHRMPSSNYGSFDDNDMISQYPEDAEDGSSDFEVPTRTEIATAIKVSNGSNITFGNRIKPREESMFEDISIMAQNEINKIAIDSDLMRCSSTKSVIRHHKKASSVEQNFLPQSIDVRGSLFMQPSDLKDDALPAVIHGGAFERPIFGDLEDLETKSSIVDNSLFADNTDDDIDFANAKRVTMIFEDYQSYDSPIKTDLISRSPFKSPPIKSPHLKSVENTNFINSNSGTLASQHQHLEPKRPAPKVSDLDSHSVDSQKIKKSNWFTKFFSSLISHEHKHHPKKVNKNIKFFKSPMPVPRLKRSVKNVLEIKKKEGTLSNLKENGNVFNATIPSNFALGKPLKFEIEFLEGTNEIKLTKIRGSKRIFKNLISAMEYIVENGSI